MKPILIITFLLAFTFASTTIINVPAEQPTIQDGIDSATNGDTVLVAQGIYIETGSNFLTTADSTYIDSTIIDGNNTTRPVTILGSVDSTMVFTGFTVQNGSIGGIGCGQGASPIISYNTVRNNHGHSNNAGIACSGAGIPIIRYNKIVGNINGTMSSDNGGGIACVLGGSPIIYNNIIKNNSANNGGGIYCDNASPVIRYNTISGDSAGTFGGGIYCGNNSNPEIRYNLICDNQTIVSGGGIYSTNSQPLIENNTICGNNSFFYGSAMYTEILLPTISNNIFANNTGPYAVLTGAALNYCAFYNNPGGHFSGTPSGTGVITTINTNGDSCDVYYNIFMDPLFENTTNNNFHLTASSPCIDAGDPAFPLDPDGTITDMGALYFDQGGTVVSGGYVSGTWTEVQSPYRILGNITIHADSTLTIDPGVEVNFQGIYNLTVNGYLDAVGTEADSIHFFPADTSAGWNGINFSSAPDSSHMSYCTVQYASYGGGFCGGIDCNSSNPVISHCTISHCEGIWGGGIRCSNSSAGISYCTITGNQSFFEGGGIYIDNSSPLLTGCTISDNSAPQGGGIQGRDDSPIFLDCIINGNTAIYSGPLSGYGGGICNYGGSPSLTGCVISNNIASRGAGIYFGAASTTLTSCDFLNNESGDYDTGGAAHCWSGTYNFSYCTFSGGFGTSTGGIYLIANATIDHCTFNELNSLSYAADVHVEMGSASVSNCVHSNIDTWSSYALYGVGDITYSDFYGNCNSIIGGPAGFGELTTVNANGDSCDVYNNIFMDPLFVGGGDLHLTEDSPCIDAGDPAFPLDPDGTITDMGALYFDQTTALDPPQNVTIEIIGTDIHLSWDAVTGANSYKVYSSYDPYTGFVEDFSGLFTGESWSTSIANEKKFYYVTALN